jgi:hypothetical protein
VSIKKNNAIIIEKEENKDNKDDINNISLNIIIKDEEDDDIIKSFKEDIIKNTIYNYEIIKSKPKIPDNYFDKFSD